MDYLKGRLQLIKERRIEISSHNSKALHAATSIIDNCQRYNDAHATDDKVKRFINVIMGYASTIISNSTNSNITLLNLDDNMKEIDKIIAEMESEKK